MPLTQTTTTEDPATKGRGLDSRVEPAVAAGDEEEAAPGAGNRRHLSACVETLRNRRAWPDKTGS